MIDLRTYSPVAFRIDEVMSKKMSSWLSFNKRFFYTLNEKNGALLAHMFSVDRDETKEPKELTHLLKEPIKTNFYEGTFYTLEKALRAFYDDIKLKEWYEYGGKPYYFKLELNSSGISGDELIKIEQIIKEYKNVRSIYEGANINVSSRAKIYTGILSMSGESISVFPLVTKNIQNRVTITHASTFKQEESIKLTLNLRGIS